jgi:hypothetical protein
LPLHNLPSILVFVANWTQDRTLRLG